MAIPGQFTTIRVTFPETTNGLNIAYDENQQAIMKEMELPLTAKPFIEEENKHLPIHLRKKIQILNYQSAPPAASLVKGVGKEMLKEAEQKAATVTIDPELAALRAEVALLREKDQLRKERELLGEEDGGGEDSDLQNAAPAKKKAGRPAKTLENA